MLLIDHINKTHKGSRAEFARLHDRRPHLVSQWLREEAVFFNGEVYTKAKKRKARS